MAKLRAGRAGDLLRQAIGPCGVAAPQTTFDIGQQLRSGVAGLGQQVAGALATQFEVVHPLRIEKHHGLGSQRAVLGGTEGQHIDAGAPGHICRFAAQEVDGIGEARAVHVQAQAVTTGHGAQCGNGLGPIAGPQFRRLGERDRGGLHGVDIGRMRVDRLLQGVRIDAAMIPGHQRQARAA